MEEIYIIKLKGLPSSSQESLRDNKASFYYRKDLTGEALLGFGVLHLLVGSTLIVLSVINLLLHKNGSQLLGSGVWSGAIFAIAGLMGIITAQKRKTDISKSKIQVKIFFALSIVTFMLTSAYLTLLIFDMKEPTANQYIECYILLSFIFELFTSLLSLFTCVRVIWPGSLSCCAKDWPMQPKLKRKVIVSTQIYTNGVKQDEDLIRNLGPNCVISLSPPQSAPITRSDNYLLTASNNCNEYVSLCDCCDQNFINRSEVVCTSSVCPHNLRSTHCEDHEQYDSDFDVENFDSVVENENCDSNIDQKHEIDLQINQNMDRNDQRFSGNDDCLHSNDNDSNDSNDSNDDNECKYETIVQNESESSLESNKCLNTNDCVETQNQDSNGLEITIESITISENCEKPVSEQSIAQV